jgi:hypothetical protein
VGDDREWGHLGARGTSFFLQASTEGATLSTVAGYATLGGIFFLVSALRLGRAAKGN